MFRIIIVDDDPATRHVLRRLLEPEGFRVDEAADASEAMRRIAVAPPAVALVDIHMPGANGLWLADQIRAISPTTAIVLVTGDADVPPYESLRKGVIAYLLKPPNRSELVHAIDQGLYWSASEEKKSALDARVQPCLHR